MYLVARIQCYMNKDHQLWNLRGNLNNSTPAYSLESSILTRRILQEPARNSKKGSGNISNFVKTASLLSYLERILKHVPEWVKTRVRFFFPKGL